MSRSLVDESNGSVGVSTGTPTVIAPKYLDINWTHTDLTPTMVSGFRVVLFTGTDPNDSSKYLFSPDEVGPSDRRLVKTITTSVSLTGVKCAVQTLYKNGNESSWRVLGGSVVVDPDTKTLATIADIESVRSEAQNAQTTADGKINSYFQTSPPTGLTATDVGDIWFDTDDGNKVYRWSGTQWLVAQDSGIARAISDASTAQGTADGKAVIFYQPSAPTGRSSSDQGDLWVDTDDNMKVYAWSGTAWVLAQDWYSANSAASAASAAAISAHTSLDTIADDSVLSKGEKPQVIIDWEAAKSEHDVLYAQMQANGLTTDPYLDAYSALQTYMGGLGYNDTTWVLSDQAIDPQRWRSVWAAYYSSKSSLILNLGSAAVPIIQAATTAGVNLSTNSSLVVDGYTCVGGETIMVKNNGSDNGLYSVLYTAGGASAQTIFPTTHFVSEGAGSNFTDENGYVDIIPSPVGTTTYGVVWSGFPVVSSTSGTLTITLDTTSTDEIQPVVVYYSTDGGGTWSVLGSSSDNNTHTYTQALSGVALSQVQVKVTTHTARAKVWNPDFGQWEFMIENSTALVRVVQISTTATGSSNYSLVYQGPVSDKSAWSVLSGTTYGTKKWVATVSGSFITLTLSPDQSGTVGNATTTAAGLVKVGSGLSVTSDGTLSATAPSYSTFTSSASGLAPASGGGTSNFLRADGSWATPPSSGGGIDSNTAYQMSSLGVGTSPGSAGEIRATGDITAYFSSDSRLKENITPISNSLNKVCSIGGFEFDWTENYIGKRGGEDGYFVRKHDVGVIAQDVLEILPEAVSKRLDGYLGVSYDKLVPLLIQAVKELKYEVDSLRSML